MSQKTNEKLVILVATLASAGLIVQNILMGWDFWVPLVVLVGIVSLWAIHLSERIDYDIRKMFYFGYAALLVLYHGVQKTSFFDIMGTACLVLVTYSLLNTIYMMNLALLEYFVLLFVHIIDLPGGKIEFSELNITRVFLHIVIVLLVYFISIKSIGDRLETEDEMKRKEERIEMNDSSMEDFLANISHELRTPVNVVNGMSDLLMKKGMGKEAESIKTAGIRLANQIEDIQDYTECKRETLFIEEDNYMSTSLINDVVTSFRESERTRDLELVVDMDAKVPTMLRGDVKKLHKMFRHLLENAEKFTRTGGIYVRLYSVNTESGINLCIEVTDTGIGMDEMAVQSITEGMYQANKKRNRSSGGIGLGLFIVYGFAHWMGGFVRIESMKKNGTTVRVTIPQKVVNDKPCLALEKTFDGAVLFHVKPSKYKVPRLRDFYRNMAANLAAGIRVPLYSAETVYEVERLKEKLNVTHVFMGQEEYEENRGYFEELAKEDIVVAVSAEPGFSISENSRIILMPKPLYAYPVIKILNEGRDAKNIDDHDRGEKPVFKGVHALIVDDEPMNLIVASSLFKEYEMIIETAESGKEAIRKYRENDYDVIFMDHMMPEMDGVEAMKLIKTAAANLDRSTIVIALTANVVSGAKEMFIREGFDGFIAKPINTTDFERVMQRVLPGSRR
ncbi:MAG: response regulator [Lachnospiraceae bacterium]|nr:response regulator [Lachnospiraceae bacterium]